MNRYLQSKILPLLLEATWKRLFLWIPSYIVYGVSYTSEYFTYFSSLFKVITFFQVLDHVLMCPWRPDVICFIPVKQVCFLCSEYCLKYDVWLPTCCSSSRTDWTIQRRNTGPELRSTYIFTSRVIMFLVVAGGYCGFLMIFLPLVISIFKNHREANLAWAAQWLDICLLRTRLLITSS